MKICELFSTIQGETVGSNFGTGFPTIFVRVSGCDIGCLYCDTQYAKTEPGTEMSPSEIVDKCLTYSFRRVCLSGGNPDAVPEAELRDLLLHLKAHNFWVTVEASGQCNPKRFMLADSVVMDVKTISAGKVAQAKTENSIEYISYLRKQDQVKFVIQSREDYDTMAHAYITNRSSQSPQFLASPMFDKTGKHNAAQIAAWILQDGYDIVLNLQIHKLVWDVNARGR